MEYSDLNFKAKQKWFKEALSGLIDMGIDNNELEEGDLDNLYACVGDYITDLEAYDFFGTEGLMRR